MTTAVATSRFDSLLEEIEGLDPNEDAVELGGLYKELCLAASTDQRKVYAYCLWAMHFVYNAKGERDWDRAHDKYQTALHYCPAGQHRGVVLYNIAVLAYWTGNPLTTESSAIEALRLVNDFVGLDLRADVQRLIMEADRIDRQRPASSVAHLRTVLSRGAFTLRKVPKPSAEQ